MALEGLGRVTLGRHEHRSHALRPNYTKEVKNSDGTLKTVTTDKVEPLGLEIRCNKKLKRGMLDRLMDRRRGFHQGFDAPSRMGAWHVPCFIPDRMPNVRISKGNYKAS